MAFIKVLTGRGLLGCQLPTLRRHTTMSQPAGIHLEKIMKIHLWRNKLLGLFVKCAAAFSVCVPWAAFGQASSALDIEVLTGFGGQTLASAVGGGATVVPDQTRNGIWMTHDLGSPTHSGVKFIPFSFPGAKPTEVIWSEVLKTFFILCPGIGKVITYSAISKTLPGSYIATALTEGNAFTVPGLQTSSNITVDKDGVLSISTDGSIRQMVYIPPPAPSIKHSVLQALSLAAAVDPVISTYPLPVPAGAVGAPSVVNFAVAPDKSVWFTQTAATDAKGNPIFGQEYIGRLSANGVISQFKVPTLNAGTGDKNTSVGNYITLGPDGNVWFTEEHVGKIGRVTPDGVMNEFALPSGASSLLGLVSGPDGNLWIRDYGGKIYRMSTSGSTTTYRIPTTSYGSDRELVPGPDGALWFLEDSAIGRINMAGAITEYPLPIPTVAGSPMYPFQLHFSADGMATYIEYSTNSLSTFNITPGTLSLAAGWNLVGNSSLAPWNVSSVFGKSGAVNSVWKWNYSTGQWAFYTPSQADGGAAFAASKGYTTLVSVNPGEGLWVNMATSFIATLPSGPTIRSATLRGKLGRGWSLLAVGDSSTPAQFNVAMGNTSSNTATVPQNVLSVWAWDAASQKWFFYAPSLDTQGGTALLDFINSQGYLDFVESGVHLGPTTGFWVNRP
jgi:streptogramin lyase